MTEFAVPSAPRNRRPHPDWYQEIELPGVSDKRPGIYEWRINGRGVYIGQYTSVSRPRKEYARAVRRLRAEPRQHYRKSNPDGFRCIHRALAQAATDKCCVTLTILENCDDKIARNRRERELIADRRRDAEAGGLPVLNST